MSKPRVLIIGSTGRIGSRVAAEIAKVDAVEVVYSSRTLEQVEGGTLRNDARSLQAGQATEPDSHGG
jgi:saccharopine dehydrogenase-like NADP-dependent oxidoreductase